MQLALARCRNPDHRLPSFPPAPRMLSVLPPVLVHYRCSMRCTYLVNGTITPGTGTRQEKNEIHPDIAKLWATCARQLQGLRKSDEAKLAEMECGVLESWGIQPGAARELAVRCWLLLLLMMFGFPKKTTENKVYMLSQLLLRSCAEFCSCSVFCACVEHGSIIVGTRRPEIPRDVYCEV